MKTPLHRLTLLIALAFFSLKAQIHNPVSWETSVETNNRGKLVLVAKATIEQGWHLYSQNIGEGGPIPTTFMYPEDIITVGSTTESAGIQIEDPIFGMPIKYFSKQAIFKQEISVEHEVSFINASVEYMACNDEMCLPPKEVNLEFEIKDSSEISQDMTSANDTKDQENKSYWLLFGLSFIAGLTALVTPCVFPMIPMTVSFFTKQSKNKALGIRNAIIYGISIVVIYVFLGTFVVGVFGADALNKLSTSVGFNLVFFGVLIFFSMSFLGAYELVLPSSWGTKLDEKADRGGLVGIFFMALALAVVSFSCTGPIVGTALVQSASQGGIAPIISMLGFSLAIAVPFTLFAVFPGWLNSLPKSGGWLNTVKVVLGFLELALAFKFLSNADLVLQAHWLEREVFIAIWIVIFLLLGVYLLGKIRLPHDYQPTEKISITRLFLAMLSLIFVVYMIPGLLGAPVKLIGAFVPPIEYSENPNGFINKSTHPIVLQKKLPEGAHMQPPYNILTFNDYVKGMRYAKQQHKPILLDFTGRACVNCRKMEQNVWISPKVLNILQNEIVLISLYVDDRQKLASEEISTSTGKPYRYIGQKWSEFQEKRYKTNAQPFYVILNSEGKDVSAPVGYTPDIAVYLDWLQQGIDKAKK